MQSRIGSSRQRGHKTFKECFRYFTVFLLWSSKTRGLKNNQEPKNFWIFFGYCSIINAKLIFVTPSYGTDAFRKMRTYS